MSADFDHIAVSYDNSFTTTLIGRAQREMVYASLDACIDSFDGKDILEINCGTGEDALYMNQKGAQVTATDISPKMIAIAHEKSKSIDNLSFEVLDINSLNDFNPTQKYDLIFSNFGGLNCLNQEQVKGFLIAAKEKLKPEGKMCMVIMPEKCAWETAYFLAKFKFKSAFRRGGKKGAEANVEEKKVLTYYYSPHLILKLALGYKLVKLNPIGLFVPPSYLEPFFKKRPKKLQKLIKKDQKRIKKARFSSIADHYFICLERN